MIRRNFLAAVLGATVVVGAVWGISPAGAGDASPSALGDVDFPTSGSREAQAHFLRGVAAMHSFWYEEALEAFQAAAAIQPDFAMAYWGEAMAHNHPVWREQDTAAGRTALQKVKTDAVLTPRERAYLDAVKTLYGEGEKAARDERYARAMAHVYRTYPEDTEAACFYSLALLARVPASMLEFTVVFRQVRLRRKFSIKFQTIRALPITRSMRSTTQDLAVLALPAARRYAQIAPASHHAQHMPAHISCTRHVA